MVTRPSLGLAGPCSVFGERVTSQGFASGGVSRASRFIWIGLADSLRLRSAAKLMAYQRRMLDALDSSELAESRAETPGEGGNERPTGNKVASIMWRAIA